MVKYNCISIIKIGRQKGHLKSERTERAKGRTGEGGRRQ